MAIGSEISIYSTQDFQFANMWDFVISDISLAGIENPSTLFNLKNIISTSNLQTVGNIVTDILMKYKITNCTLSTPGFTVEDTSIGKKYYEEKEWEGDFSITIMEDTTFSAWTYFRNWMEQIYDFDLNVWRSYPKNSNSPIPSPNVGISFPTKFATIIYYHEFLPIPTCIFFLENVKIKKIGDITQDRTTDDPLKLIIDLTYEKLSYETDVQLITQITSGIASLFSPKK
jgi:hypothetical protein